MAALSFIAVGFDQMIFTSRQAILNSWGALLITATSIQKGKIIQLWEWKSLEKGKSNKKRIASVLGAHKKDENLTKFGDDVVNKSQRKQHSPNNYQQYIDEECTTSRWQWVNDKPRQHAN